MPRKSKPSSETEKEIFPTRLRELMEERSVTQKKLADAIDMRPQTVSLYTTGQSVPDVNTLRKMSEFFHVSADYLLGLTGVKKPDTTIQSVCEYTGLSESAISCLHSAKLQNQNLQQNPIHARIHAPWEPDNLDMLSYLLTNRKFFIGVLDKFIELGVCAVSLLKPMHLLTPEEFRDIPKDHILLSGVEYVNYLRYELLHDIEQIIDRFTSEIRDANTADIDNEGGLDNGVNQETD